MKYLLALNSLLLATFAFGQTPEIVLSSATKEKPIEISRLELNIEVVGNIATTTYDVVFFNPNGRDLEGELSLPLGDGKEIYRYALEVNGKLREGVMVEKIKARQAFEAVVRQKIDPGLVNKTKGNFFKTKIYPLPAKGTKRVVLGVVETLTGDQKKLYYALTSDQSKTIGEFKLNVDIIKGQIETIAPASDFENLEFDSNNEVYNLKLERKKFTFDKPLKFTIPRFSNSDHQLFTQEKDGITYFYLVAKAPKLNAQTKKLPQRIHIYWDHSHSATHRNINKELELLSTYLKNLQGPKLLSVVDFNHKEGQKRSFEVDNDPTDLIDYIRNMSYDGATRLDHINFDKKCDEILLFTDAINTIGEAKISAASTPVYSIVSGLGSNYNLLKQVSAESNGVFIDLNKTQVNKAIQLMLVSDEKLLSIDHDPDEIVEMFPNQPVRVDGYVELAGILKAPSARITINYGRQSKITQIQSFEIRRKSNANVARIWASKKIAALEWDYSNHQEEILALGKQFNVVTRNSSLLVLDRVEDYVTHEIVPPAELRAAYNQLMAEKPKDESTPFHIIVEQNIQRVNRLKRWYDQKKMTSDSPKIVEIADGEALEDIPVTTQPLPPRPDDIEVDIDVDAMEEVVIEEIVFSAEPEDEIMEEHQIARALSGSVEGVNNNDTINSSLAAKPSIKVLAWLPDAPYMITLRKADRENIDKVYFELKGENKDRPSFYIQVADLYFERGLRDRAIEVLTNTIEMDLENPELLKVVGRRLLDEGELELAISIYKEIKNLRPEEPQSYRDLALAYTANHQYQTALEIYQYILDQEWERFEEIKDVVFNEFSALISLYKKELNLKKINLEYYEEMPLDIRIVIDWSSNENDIDLWVIDPNGEKCLYSNPNTRLGGKISKDFTRGYGPEEYTLKTAKRGTYTIYVNYYSESRQTITGPVTVYATLFTRYGTDQQRSEKVAIQLTDNKETKQIGQLEFEN